MHTPKYTQLSFPTLTNLNVILSLWREETDAPQKAVPVDSASMLVKDDNWQGGSAAMNFAVVTEVCLV
jgi:hypothetical protein